jgi:hypothetical protein
MKDLGVVTVLYNYPDFALPIFYKRGLKFFDQSDIHVFRFESAHDSEYNAFADNQNDYYSKLFFYKIVKFRRELLKIASEYKHILFLDALDTGILKSKDVILDRYKAFNRDIVLGAERGLWPVTDFTDGYKDITPESDATYLNSGTYIGTTEKILEALQRIQDFGREKVLEDQGAWTRLFLSKEMNLTIDYNRSLFFSTHETKSMLNIEDGQFKGFIDTDPCIIHDNGPYNDELTFKLAEHFKEE